MGDREALLCRASSISVVSYFPIAYTLSEYSPYFNMQSAMLEKPLNRQGLAHRFRPVRGISPVEILRALRAIALRFLTKSNCR